MKHQPCIHLIVHIAKNYQPVEFIKASEGKRIKADQGGLHSCLWSTPVGLLITSDSQIQ